jgi:hypothetical protein
MNVGTLIYGAGSSKTAGSEAKRLAVSEEPVLLVTDDRERYRVNREHV